MKYLLMRKLIVIAAVAIAVLGSEPAGRADLGGSAHRELVVSVMADLEALLGEADLDRKGRKRLQEAVDRLARAEAALANDDIREALRHAKRAARKLEKAQKRGLAIPEALLILVEVSRQAALDRLAQARQYAGSSERIDALIERASRRLVKAEQAWARGKVGKAIGHARRAWKKAHKAALLGAAMAPELPDPPAATSPPFCSGLLQVQGVDAVVCEFPINWVFKASDIAPFATSQFGVTIQAVGGRGGDGGSTAGGTVGAGAGGRPGLAQTTLRGDALAGKSLFIYVADNGKFGSAAKGGSGGAATVVATAALSPTPKSLDEMIVAAGGGGGGQGLTSATATCLELPLPTPVTNEVFISCGGGDGGVAIAVDEQNRFGFAGLGSTPPVYTGTGDGSSFVAGLGAGQPARFDAGSWVPGAGAGDGKAGSADFSFAGAPGDGRGATWVRENADLTLGDVTVLGGNGSGAGGAGGGGVAGGGGSAEAGGGGGASYVVGSSYGLPVGETFPVPCDPSGFCAQNWFSPAGTDEPAVVITFWLNEAAQPIVPSNGETIDSDQPSLVFEGSGASAGIQYLLENDVNEFANYNGLGSRAPTGNSLWTVPPGLLEAGQTYNWLTTDQAGNPLQATKSFMLGENVEASASAQGWTLYVRSFDNQDADLPAAEKPLSNQPVPPVSTACFCDCPNATTTAETTPEGSEYPFCDNAPSGNLQTCECKWLATADPPDMAWFWEQPATGGNCTASSGSCYANAQLHLGAIDVDWASPTNVANLQVPPRLINVTTEPSATSDGTPVPSLALPALEGFSGSCADETAVEVTFTVQTNGSARFFVYADPETGEPTSSQTVAVNDWNIEESCTWEFETEVTGPSSNTNLFTIDFMKTQAFIRCQSSLEVMDGKPFCLKPGMPYRVRFDGVVPYLPGPMRLGFKLASMDSSPPIPANWMSTCILDGTTQNCEMPSTDLFVSPQLLPRAPDVVAASGNSNLGDGVTHAHSAASIAVEAPSSPDEGTAGATSCTSTGTSVQCIWSKNGTWELPASYTQPGGWIIVQALGGKGGAGSGGSGTGGAPGRAQAVVPSESLAGKTLYVYVGHNGSNVGTDGVKTAGGGAASLVTTSAIPQAFVNNGCSGTAASIEALAIAAGGGGIGWPQNTQGTAPGGAGGIAIGGSGIMQTIGAGSPGGQVGESLGGQSPAYGANPFDGISNVSGGFSADLGDPAVLFPSGSGPIALGGAGSVSDGVLEETRTGAWLKNTSFLTLNRPDSTDVCGGGFSNSLGAGDGGGGHAGGAAGAPQFNVSSNTAFAAGGAGGSSWSVGAGSGRALPAALSEWQTLADEGPSQVVITVPALDCAMESTSQRPILRCTFTQSGQPLSLSALNVAIAELIGQEISNDVPVYLEAWGGRGGNGGAFSGSFCFANGGKHGGHGYARSSHTYGTLSSAFPELWLYVGANGINGEDCDNCSPPAGEPGGGGAATLVLSAPLSAATDLDDVVLIGAGGGGGGMGYCDDFQNNGLAGESGSQAVATTSGAVSVAGQGDASGGNRTGGCLSRAPCGNDGIGGQGGGILDGPETGWVGISSSWTQGQGGHSIGYNVDGSGRQGGAGGGGLGGGGVGHVNLQGRVRGGGAGGSYAAQGTLDDSDAPVQGGDPSAGSGAVVISFDVCKTDPTLSVCQP